MKNVTKTIHTVSTSGTVVAGAEVVTLGLLSRIGLLTVATVDMPIFIGLITLSSLLPISIITSK